MAKATSSLVFPIIFLNMGCEAAFWLCDSHCGSKCIANFGPKATWHCERETNNCICTFPCPTVDKTHI
ncbi:unnamed protein product [Eruca vesicaria subsp. sativa]|uniref:Defensin-like protein n=1 Tax=Eruca vesicaria subsp. sativa TaxID=29727 RepID=A0ABC8L4M1_ERUVS|nr:unnamed protein product [Eruca vesicaria subsp. sativa]CAH8375897.1 unnamed protein product [Eruca vesicaria subsp. sativa]